MSKIAVLQATQTEGEYQAVEWQEYDGDLEDYLLDCLDCYTDVCPDAEIPVVHNGGGVTLRTWNEYSEAEKAAGAQGDGWYTYEQFIEE